MSEYGRVLVALSGGVDSAVAAWLLQQQGYAVDGLHMTNWEDDDGYCDAAADLRDARGVCDRLGIPLHRVNFADAYRKHVFDDFLSEIRAGRTPNPDVLCNREIKFGRLVDYARRLGADHLATGHYARLGEQDGEPVLRKGLDSQKDQSYFLHAVATADFERVLFPLGELTKTAVRELARGAELHVAEKRDSTGICFIGERPFRTFLSRYMNPRPGPVVTEDGDIIGEHQGLHLYTLGQRKGLGIGGIEAAEDGPWYVAGKIPERNELLVVQGHDHPLLESDWLETEQLHWIGPAPAAWQQGLALDCGIKTRYRQADQSCRLIATASGGHVAFDRAQRAVTPGQYAVFYDGDRCLGGARIERSGRSRAPDATAGAPAMAETI
ncbi:MAG TPA: tRNA 2-thiouridine(34) synthase MnmA [Gammaproteobacteria bacterium]|nr:tRNA 2-thiouridine(34) synthase MnmA [Gammaproteobacteria bacterium]